MTPMNNWSNPVRNWDIGEGVGIVGIVAPDSVVQLKTDAVANAKPGAAVHILGKQAG